MKRLLLASLWTILCPLCVSAASPYPTLSLGAPAPDFNLPGVDGRNYTLKDFADKKVLVIIFTCNHCPTAQMYEPRIKQLASDYQGKSVAVVAINPNDPRGLRLDELGYTDLGDSLAEMKIRARDRKFNYPYLDDGVTEKAAQAYGPVATPHAFVFDGERKLRYVGAIDDSEREQLAKQHYVRDAIDALLACKEPAVTQTRAIGCSVKWAGKADFVKRYMENLAAEPVSLEKVDAAALKELRKNGSDKFWLVTFWATWCAPCVAEFNEFITINRMYRHRDFELITVSLNRPDEEAAVLAFLKKQQASNRNLIFASSEREKLVEAFDLRWQGDVPYTVLISPTGKIVYRETGSVDPLQLKRSILKALGATSYW